MSGYFLGLLIVQMIAAVVIIILTLLQQGKGADMGAAFGSGSAGSLFGSSGSANFLSRMTSATAVIFFVTTMAMAYLSSKEMNTEGSSIYDTVEQPAVVVPLTNTDAEIPTSDNINQIPNN